MQLAGIDLERLSARLPERPLTRFAPAPTGWLHLGHVLNADFVWSLARALDGRVLLRIEDHDRERSRPEFEAGILDDLDWLGFKPDIFSPAEFRAGASEGRQSDRAPVYQAALAILQSKGLVYACACTRRTIAPAAEEGRERRYPGTCRARALPLDGDHTWRVRLDASLEAFDDGLLGRQTQAPAGQCGDIVVRDRRGNWTYQFAVTVDDWQQGIDLVVRGTDLLSSTGRQIQLGRLLGRERPPLFVHHPLIVKPTGRKLSKSDRDTGVRDLRRAGSTPAQVLALARRSVGM